MTNFTMLCRNRIGLTRQAIDSLSLISSEWGDMWSGKKGKAAIKVLIMDDRSDKETVDYLSSMCGHDSFEVVRNEIPLGTGILRNSVIRASEECYGRGDYLYIADNDSFFFPGWLDKLIERYEYAWTYGYRVLGAYNHPFNQPISRMEGVYEVNHLASQSMLMKWKVWDQFGPFVETPIDKVCQSEDVVFSENIRVAGYKVGVVSPWLVANAGITNSFGEHIPGWEIVKSQCPPGVICE